MIDVESATKSYGKGEHEVVALSNVSLKVESGTRIAITGKSGSGKSTLLNILAGMDRPTSGIVSVDNQRLDKLNSVQMARYRKTSIGIVFQAFQLLPNQTALQNIELPLMLSGVTRSQRRERAKHWLEQVGLADRAGHFPYALSGGEQQRIAIARALVHEPNVLLADEPTGNLDSTTAQQVEDLLMNLCETHGATFVLVTHNPQLAVRCGETRYEMRDGQIEEA